MHEITADNSRRTDGRAACGETTTSVTPVRIAYALPVPQNTEIKARLHDRGRVLAALAALNAIGPTVLRQSDIFFNTATGRLKLRSIDGPSGPSAELIAYHRPDATGPTTSEYVVVPVPDAALLRDALARTCGERVVVDKVRTLYLVGPTRVHLDSVTGLGEFLELEVVLESTDRAADGQRIASDLLARFGIGEKDLISGAYADLLGGTIR